MGTARALVAGSGTCLHRITTTSASSDAWKMGGSAGGNTRREAAESRNEYFGKPL
jgi:hypothetical protein